MLLPSKLQSGQNFKTATVKAVNNIIDYLKTQRLSGDGKTIKVNQCSAGITLSAVGAATGRAGGSSDPFNHPFKLIITSDDNGSPQVSVKLGIVYFQGAYEGEYYGIGYQKIQGVDMPAYIPFDWEAAEDGAYGINAVIYDYEEEEGGCYLMGCCLVTDANDSQIVSAPGFYVIPLGIITKTTIEGENQTSYSLAVTEQGIVGDIILNDSHRYQPFAIRFFIDFGEEGELKHFEDFTVTAKVNNGVIYYGDTIYELADEEGILALEYGSYYCCCTGDVIKWYTEEDFYNLELSAECFCLAAFHYQGFLAYQQYIRGDLVFKGQGGNFPFKLSVQTGEEGVPMLYMTEGDLRMQYTSTDIIRFQERCIDFTGLEDGVYGVIGVAQTLNGKIYSKIFFCTQDVTTFDIPSLSGFFAFPIGAIQVYTEQTPEGEAIQCCSVLAQFIYGDVFIDCRYYDLPFCTEVEIDCGEQYSVLTSSQDFTIQKARVNSGMIYDKNVPDSSYVNDMIVTLSDENDYKPESGINYCFLQAKLNNQTGLRDFAIKWDKTIEPFFEYEGENLVTEKYVLSVVYVDDVLSIQNYHPSDFIFEKADTYKVKCNGLDSQGVQGQDDPEPGFLIDKLMGSRRSLDILQECWNDHFGEGHASPGYIYMELDCRPKTSSEIRFYWDFISMPGWCENYLSLNCKEGFPIWEAQGMIRMTAEDETAGFLPDKVTAKQPITVEVKNQKLEFSIDMSKFTGSIKNAADGCFTIEDVSTDPVNNGKQYQLKLDEDCLFNKLKITGENPIIVTGSGKEWKISFDDAEYIKTISGDDCLKAEKNGSNISLKLDLDCLTEDLISIEGKDPIAVTQDGNKFTISIDQEKIGGGGSKVTAGECISIEQSGEGEEKSTKISVDKECIFTSFSITGDEYITVNGSGESWELSLNPDVFGKVKVSEGDTLGFLGDKLISSEFIVIRNNGNSLFAELGEGAIECGDDSLEVYVTNGFATINSKGKVRVDADGELGYLFEKIQSSDQSLVLQTTGDTVDLWINQDFFTSSDDSIIIQKGDNLDFKSTGKVKVSEGDSADYLGAKIKIDSSLASLITLENTGSELIIKSAIQGSGIMLVNNGQISLLQAPQGKAVLVADGGSIGWKEYGTCQDSCGN